MNEIPEIPFYLEHLNAEQRAAAGRLDGPVLVLAGAGTGKTRVLTTRLAHILLTGRASPAQILAVTFTNKAAQEMKERVAGLIQRPVEGWWLGTFHALAARMLRQHAELVSLRPNFTILDTDDQLRLIKQILQAENLDDRKWPARLILGIMERWKDRGLGPDKVSPQEAGDILSGRMLEIYERYQERLLILNACDFGDLLLHTLTIFQRYPHVLKRYQELFRYILVDEYQDTNVAQYLWLRLLAQKHRNLCCVGDDDQSIYGWRGAELGNILKFESDFPGAEIIRLEQNYRSTPEILAAASALIAHNQGRLGKTLWTEAEGGDKLTVRGVWDGEEEARQIGEAIEAVERKGIRLGAVAILVRASFQTREFEDRFITLGLKYRVIGGPRFYERLEIRDAIAYFRVLHQPDDDLAFERIINKPRRGIGEGALQNLHALARQHGISLTKAAEAALAGEELRPALRRALSGLLNDFARWRSLLDQQTPAEVAAIVLDESGYTEMWQNDKSIEAPGRLENIRELINALEEFPSLGGFLEHVGLVMEKSDGDPRDMVNIMTLHSAKGLEFDYVFLPGWEEGLFPHQRSLEEKGVEGLEEERRLAYVGLTRARRHVSIFHAVNRRVHNQWQASLPSRFIGELPASYIEIESDPGLYRSRMPTGGGPGLARLLDRATPSTSSAWSSSVIEGKASRIMTRFAPGDRIFHQKFGYGSVRLAEGDRLDIAFDKAGDKKVMAEYVMPADQAH